MHNFIAWLGENFIPAWKAVSILFTGAFGILGLVKNFKEKKVDQETAWSVSHFLRLLCVAIVFLGGSGVFAQTSSTGALEGITLDPSNLVIPGVVVRLVNSQIHQKLTGVSDEQGRFKFLLLAPGIYELEANKPHVGSLQIQGIVIAVTETYRLELQLRLGTVVQNVQVYSQPSVVRTDDSALGRMVNQYTVNGLPLVTRNFSQIAVLSPGVVAGVFNAGELGMGGMALSQITKSNDGIFVQGARSYQNNYELDGISVSDVESTGSASGGPPIPTPDAIQEFKMQTGLYDAAYGRFGGANISVVTETGGNAYHGTIFEFFRNGILNANDFFLNQTGQQRPALQQNQFGAAMGGPIRKDKLFFFGAYQGTRQTNGVAVGQARIACTASLVSPPLTNDRSPAALGKLFADMKGALGGVAVQLDGSNINPVALSLLNFELPDGNFLIPTPQTVNSSKPFASQGLSVFSQPCPFSEDQFSANGEYLMSPRSNLSAHFFFANDAQTVSFPGNGLNAVGNIAGFPSPGNSAFRVFSLVHTYTLSSALVNQVRFGFVHTEASTGAVAPFKWSDVGVAEGDMNDENGLPSLNILGSVSMAPAFSRTFAQSSFVLGDALSYARGPHTLMFGGSITRVEDDVTPGGLGAFVQFLSWPDFLLGLNSSSNGTGTFSNVYASEDAFGLYNREYRVWEGSAFAQDDYKISRSLTLNLGLRYERLGLFADNLGRNSSFDISKADPDPPPTGSVAGYIVASNFPGTVPPGVLRAGNTLANNGAGQNTLGPRIGFAWQPLSNTQNFVIRGGYGIYYSRLTGQAFAKSVVGAPFSLPRTSIGRSNAEATFQAPFAQPFPTPDSFPLFPSFSRVTKTTIDTVAPNLKPAMIPQYSLNAQQAFYDDWLFEVGFVGTRGTHLQRTRSLNQALLASTESPIRGVTTNTVANIVLRVPIVGIPADSLREMETEGSSWYNGLEVSLTKRFSQGFQFLASYTFSKTLDTDGADINGTSAGNTLTLGDQDSPGERWGRASFDRPHRFVFNGIWTLPNPADGAKRALFGGWEIAGILTIQSGSAITVAYTNANNIFGISEDRAQLSSMCSKNGVVSAGPVESKLSNYFNKSCFTTPPIIGADGVGTAFGDSATGLANGPGQANLDLSLSKSVFFDWPRERNSLVCRLEFYNTLNHPQFANPDTNFSSPTFGVITSTAVNARVGQLMLRLSF